jgi:hypothetical protein
LSLNLNTATSQMMIEFPTPEHFLAQAARYRELADDTDDDQEVEAFELQAARLEARALKIASEGPVH